MGPVSVFTDRRPEVARFYRELVGVPRDSESDDSVWLRAANARLAVHDRDDAETAAEVGRGDGFVVWFRVPDVNAAYERGRSAGRVVGGLYEDKPRPYFFTRDPDGRFIGVGEADDR